MGNPEPDTIAVLGAGSWGTALALMLAGNGHSIHLWCHRQAHADAMREQGENKTYLPGFPFPGNISITADMVEVARHCRNYMVVVPSRFFRSSMQLLAAQHAKIDVLAWASKGLEYDSGKLLSSIVTEELGGELPCAVASGPTFALEVAKGLPTAITVAGTNLQIAERVADWLRNDWVRAYTSTDIAGVQLGGAIKNVMAIAAGISDGLGMGANARAALITRGLAELSRLGIAMGGQLDTFMGLSGAGDLILTCTDNLSRNRRVGMALGQGRTLEDIREELGQETEGVHTAKELYRLALRQHVEMPITEQVYRVLYEDQSPKEAVTALLTREHKAE